MQAPAPRLHFAAILTVMVCAAALATGGCGSSTSTSTAPTPITRCGITLNTVEATVPPTGGSGAVSVSATRDCVWSASVEGNWLNIKSGTNGQGEGTVEYTAAANPDPQPRTGAVVVNGSKAQITQVAGDCIITLATSSADFPPAGGTARVDVRASSQLCAWTATSDASWIEIASGANGRGSATVTLSIAATTGPPRAATVTIAGQRFGVTQSQGCTYAIDRTADSVGANGGATGVTVNTGAACPWTAASNAEWIVVSPSTGSGPAPVTISVAPTQGPQRIGSAVIAGQLFTVTQSPGCTYQVQPTSHTVGAAGGTGSVSISTASGCSWTSASNAPWITVQGATSGIGPANVTFAVGATSGPARSGTLIVAGHQVTVTQTQGCSFAISPQSQSVDPSGGTGRVTVTAGEGCGWTATSPVPWVTITSGASGTGNGEVQFSVAAVTGPSRSTTLTIAGQTFTVNQSQGCTFRLSPSGLTIDDEGGQRSFDVQVANGCEWTAATSTPWISLNSGTSGSGNGTVRFTVAANGGPSRTGAITAGGQTFTVSQGTGCSFSLSSDRQSVPAAGGGGSVNVTAGGGCGWTAVSNAPWLSITSGADGTGNGTVGFSAAANTGAARTGTLTIANRTFTVEQAEACTYSINPTQHGLPGSGGTVDVTVTATGGCSWTATSNVPWISVTSGGSGTGNGTVRLTVEPNGGGARNGTVTIAGRTFTIEQGSGCTYSISPSSQQVPGTGGPTAVNVTTQGSCSWTASSNVPWIAVTSGGSGSGNGTVQLNIEANPGGDRAGTATIAGQTFTVTQAGNCSYTIAPTSQGVPAGGGGISVTVTAAGSCGWTATSNAPWIAVASGSPGAGNGTVQVDVAANPGAPRTGTTTIAGQTFTVNQESGCSFTVAPETIPAAAAGGSSRVEVTAEAGCAWNAASNAPWITVTAGASGNGSGPVDLAFGANTGPARSGTVSVAGRTVTVNQESGCSVAINPTSQAVPPTGGTGSVTVTAAPGCPWSATSTAPWIVVTSGASGVGDGAVQFAVEANATGAPRAGTISIGGQTFTINQQ
jgi:hypothetical protein